MFALQAPNRVTSQGKGSRRRQQPGQSNLQIISAAETASHARVAEMNRQVAGDFDKIIASLEDGGEGKEAVAGAS